MQRIRAELLLNACQRFVGGLVYQMLRFIYEKLSALWLAQECADLVCMGRTSPPSMLACGR